MRAIIANDDEELEAEGELDKLEAAETVMSEQLDKAYFSHVELPSYSVGGISQPHTMKLASSVNGSPIIVLVDSGASHNFISMGVITLLNLPLEDTSRLGAKLGDGHKVSARGVCNNVQITLGDLSFLVNCYKFDLGGVNVILGVAWLETLGEVRVNWRTMTMKFN